MIRALEFNSWFDTLCLADLKIDPTMGKCIFKVINYNRTMSKIAIKKSKVYKTFMLDLVNALITNDQTRIRSVEVNKVNFTDAGKVSISIFKLFVRR